MLYTFQESKIFEAGNPIDPRGKQQTIRAKTEVRARSRLPATSAGRTWVLIDTTKEDKAPDSGPGPCLRLQDARH